MEVTLFEFHLDDSPITAHAPFSGRAGTEDSEDSGGLFSGDSGEIEPETEADSGGGGKLGAVLALGLVVGLAIAVRRLRGRSSGGTDVGGESRTVEAPATE